MVIIQFAPLIKTASLYVTTKKEKVHRGTGRVKAKTHFCKSSYIQTALMCLTVCLAHMVIYL